MLQATKNVYELRLSPSVNTDMIPPQVLYEIAQGKGYLAVRLRGTVIFTTVRKDRFIFHAYSLLQECFEEFSFAQEDVLRLTEVRGTMLVIRYTAPNLKESDEALEDSLSTMPGDISEGGYH